MAWVDDLELVVDGLARRMGRALGEELVSVLKGQGDEAGVAQSEARDCVSAREAADRLAVSPKTVRALIGRGELAGHRVGSRFRIRREELERYLERSREAGQDVDADEIALSILRRTMTDDE